MNGYIQAECLRSYNNLVLNYNKLFDTYTYLKRENQNLQLNIRQNNKLFDKTKYRVFDAIQTQIVREKCHLEQIEQLKCKLCTKDHNINTLKQINDFNEEQIDEYQKELKCTIEKLNNQCLITECESEQLSVNSKCSCENKLIKDSKCTCEDKLNIDSKSACKDNLVLHSKSSNKDTSMAESKSSSEDTLQVDSECSCEDKIVVDSKCSCEDKIEVDSKCSCADKIEVDSKCSCADKIEVDSKCSCADKSKVESKCLCENTSKVDSKCSRENKLLVDSKCSCEDKSQVDSKCSCEGKSQVDLKCSCEDKSQVDSECKCKDKLLLENSEEHVSEGQIYDDVQQLLLAIDEYCNSKTICISILTLLKQSKSNICSLIEENDIKSNALTQCQNDLECSTNKLNEELDMSKKKDSEILTMYSDFTLLADELKNISKQKSNLESRLNEVTEELCSKTTKHDELVNKFEEQKEELDNLKCCSNIAVYDNHDECKLREICEKTHTLTDNIKIIDGLEYNFCNIEKKLKETEQLKTICENKCKQLSTQNVDLKNELEIENRNNIKNENKIENLCKRILKFEAVIKGLEIQNKNYIVDIDELKKCKCVAEQNFNEIIEELYNTIQLLRNDLANTECNAANTKQCLENKNEEDRKCFEQIICSLKNDIGNLETELKYYKCQYDSLTTKCLLNEKELSKFIDMIQLLQTREFELNKENEEYKERVSMLCTTVDCMKQELEETIQKNNELTCNNNNLRAENDVHCEDIDDLNNTLICVRKKESCVRKELVVYKEKLLKADEEISNLNSEISCVKCKLNTACADLTCTEQKLNDTELRLNEEICLKEQITRKYCKMVNCLTTNCDMEQSINPISLKSVECQYEIVADNNQTGDYCCFADENFTPCNVTNYEVQAINFEKTCSIIDCKTTKESTHIGIQTKLCCPESCPPVTLCKTVSVTIEKSCLNDNMLCCPEPCDTNKCEFGQCESNDNCKCPCQTPSIETTCQIDCHSDDCSGSGDSKLTTTCDCIAVFLEKENLKCQLAETKQLLDECEKEADKKLCEIKDEHCKKESEMNNCFDKSKSQYQTDLDEVTAKLNACRDTILCKEKDLKCCRERENQLKKDIEKLNKILRCKDKKINDYEKKIKTLCESLDECKKQLQILKCSLELEKCNKKELDKQLETLVIKPEKKIVKKLKTPEKVIVKKQRKSEPVRKVLKGSSNGKKIVLTPCEKKRMRSGADHETGYNFYGTELEMQKSRHHGRRSFTSYTREDSNQYQTGRSGSRGLGNGDPSEHELPEEFVEALRQHVRLNVGCVSENCFKGCCSKLCSQR